MNGILEIERNERSGRKSLVSQASEMVSKYDYDELDAKYKDLELKYEELELMLNGKTDEQAYNTQKSDEMSKLKQMPMLLESIVNNAFHQPDFETFKK